MADRVDLLKAMRVIQEHCDNEGCAECVIHDECMHYIRSTMQPAFWEIESGESDE